jgi:hypothetical protein
LNSQNKKPPGASWQPPPFNRRAGHVAQIKPGVAQLKTAGPAQSINRPVAPPVYCPQPVPKVLQKKVSPVQSPRAGQAPRQPVAPPIYRPQPKPVIAQAKMSVNSQIRKTTVAPPVYRPQARPNPVRRNSVVQRYTEEDTKAFAGPGLMSENSNYFIPHGDPRFILVAKGADAPRASDLVASFEEKEYKSKEYREYKSKKFIKDCLHTAEEIINQEEFLASDDNPHSQVVGTSKPFGNDYKSNVKLAEENPSNDGADPELGQAYVIVRKALVRKKVAYPYHAAAVVAVDGKDKITLEVSARAEKDAERRTSFGDYKMYTTGDVGEKFHSHWQGEFKGNWTTVVIEPYKPKKKRARSNRKTPKGKKPKT